MFKKTQPQVFLGGLGASVTDNDLRKLVADVGGVTYALVWKDSETGQSKRAGKINFESAELAQKAVKSLCACAATGHVSFETIFTDSDTKQVYIRYDKVVSWLKSRGKLQDEWPINLRQVQVTATSAMREALGDENLADEVLDYLKVREACDLLGKASSEKQNPVKQSYDGYLQSNCHIAEGALALLKIVRYELPAAKKQMQSLHTQVQEAEHKYRNLHHLETEAQKKLREMCDTHQIAGTDFGQELQARTDNAMNKFLENATSKIQATCSDPLQFYSSFSKKVVDNQEGSSETGSEMALLRFVLASGNGLLKDAADLSDELKAEWKKVQEGRSQKGMDPQAVKLLANRCARETAVIELLELQAFIVQRCSELEESGIGQSSMDDFSLDELRTFNVKITEAIESISGKEVQPILLMHGSTSALEHTVSKLSTQKGLCEKLAKRSADQQQTKSDLQAEVELSSKEVAQIQSRLQQLKEWFEAELSGMMKYKVCLFGEIDAV